MPAHPKNKPYRINRKISAGKQEYKALLGAIWGRDRGVCQLCYRDTIVPEFHHAIYRSQGGGDTLDNMLLLCFDCHIRGIHGGGKDAQKLREAAVTKMEEINGNKM